jgi:transcriptional regulator with XRE-family HTH domain
MPRRQHRCENAQDPECGVSCGSEPMSFAVDPERLVYQMSIRGLSASDLARKARVSCATMSSVCSGKRARSDTWRLVIAALKASPVDPELKKLIPPPDAEGDEPQDA